MKILALDLGTDTGVAFYDGSGIAATTWRLASATEIRSWGLSRLTRRSDPRILRFQESLKKLVVERTPDVVVYEDVEFGSFTKQTQLWASFRTVVWLVAAQFKLLSECAGVSVLKKFATNHGGATKEMMAAALFKRYPEFAKQKLNDDAIDAIWICLWGMNRLGRIKL